MADKKQTTQTPELSREYIIPLRNEWRKVANYRRAGKAIKEIKKFIARHMKVPEHNVEKVKLDSYLNQEIWFRGKQKPPARIKVKATKEGEIVRVELAELPEHWKFVQQRQMKLHKPSEKPKTEKKPETPKTEEKKEETPEEKEEKKKAESEKEIAAAEQKALHAEQEAKAQKHTTKTKEPSYHRMALQK